MSAQPVQAFVTPDEYLEIERAAEFRSEYLSGEMVAMSGASSRHERIVGNAAGVMFNALRGKPCEHFNSNLRIRVKATNDFYPDLTVVCGKADYLDNTYLDTLLNPAVIFEVLSESTESRDRGIKWRLYQEIESLQHYILIYQDVARVEVYTRQLSGDWLVHTEIGLTGNVNLPAVDASFAMRDLYDKITVP